MVGVVELVELVEILFKLAHNITNHNINIEISHKTYNTYTQRAESVLDKIFKTYYGIRANLFL